MQGLGMVVHTCNPSYARDRGKKPAQGKTIRIYLKNI
jgi:hypothetical protein